MTRRKTVSEWDDEINRLQKELEQAEKEARELRAKAKRQRQIYEEKTGKKFE